MQKTLTVVCIVLLTMLSSSETTYAARAPNRVQRDFRIVGPEALEGAKLLGIDISRSTVLVLPWAENAAPSECQRYGSQRECGVSDTHMVKVQFDPSPNPVLVLSGTFFDALSGTGPHIETYYLPSPIMPKHLDSARDWQSIWSHATRELKEKKLLIGEEIKYERDAAPSVYLSIHEGYQGTFMIFGVHLEPRAERERKSRGYRECLERHPGIDGAPC